MNKYHKLLGTTPNATPEEIKKAYRRKAMAVHPDKNPSADAQQQFIALSEAYEILTGVSKPKTQANVKHKTAEEVRAQKIKQAKKRYHKMKESEIEKDALYFEKITTGWRWNTFKLLSYYAFFFSIVLCTDFFCTGHKKAIPKVESYGLLPQAVKADGEIFEINSDKYWSMDFPPTQLNYSLLFKDLKSISVLDQSSFNLETIEKPSDRMKKFKLFESFKSEEFYSYGSVYYAFPVLHILLFFPILLVRLKKPTINFSIGRLVAIWVIFPTALILSFSNFRIFHLFGLL